MYEIDIVIQGIASILQHRFAPEQLSTLMQGANKKTGAVDYSKEWVNTMYATSDGLSVSTSKSYCRFTG